MPGPRVAVAPRVLGREVVDLGDRQLVALAHVTAVEERLDLGCRPRRAPRAPRPRARAPRAPRGCPRARPDPARNGRARAAAAPRPVRPQKAPRHAAGPAPRASRAPSATAHACSGPAPPNATRASSRASTPRSTVTTRTARFHVRVDDPDDPLRGQPGPLDRGAGSRDVQTAEPRELGALRDAPEDQVRVGDGRLGAAPAVAGGSGIRARALRTDDQRTAGVEPGDRTAAGPDRQDVERREADRQPRNLARRRGCGDAVADRGTRPCSYLPCRRTPRRPRHARGAAAAAARARRPPVR